MSDKTYRKHLIPSELPKYVDENAVEPSWMMAQAQRDMDVPSEPLGDFYWSMRINNFVGAAGEIQEGVAVDPFLAVCELEAHDFGQAQPDALKIWCGRSATTFLKRSLS